MIGEGMVCRFNALGVGVVSRSWAERWYDGGVEGRYSGMALESWRDKVGDCDLYPVLFVGLGERVR